MTAEARGQRGGRCAASALLLAAAALLTPAARAADVSRYEGICDASAAVALDAAHFAVADDEHNTLLVYRRGRAAATSSVPLAAFLGTASDEESDIEGAAAVGRRVYWVSSHGRNSKGKRREARQRFFATDIVAAAGQPSLRPVGQAYTRLLDDLLDSAALKGLGLREAAQRAPEAPGGFNIEGLAATPEGGLLIGLRNPVPGGKALLLLLDNPAELVGKAQQPVAGPARFSRAVQLDLGGRGVRSIERAATGYLIVAGPPADAGSFALYRWSGGPADAAQRVHGVDFGGLRPEALFAWPGTPAWQVLSDDGGVELRGVECKQLDAGRRSFRASLLAAPLR